MENDLRRRQARRARIRRRKRQIRIRVGLISICMIALIWLVFVNGKSKEDTDTFGFDMGAAWQQTVMSSEADTEDFEMPEVMTGWKVIVDAGHGGKDQGCAYGDVIEKDINLQIALFLQKKLEKAGIEVIMTRDDDSFVYLNRRVEAAENAGADVYISIHVDSYVKDESVNGVTVHYQEGATGGKTLAEQLHEALEEDELTRVRDVKASDLYVLRNTSMPATLVEVGFLTNSTDRSNLQSEAFLEALSESLADGIIGYLSEKTGT